MTDLTTIKLLWPDIILIGMATIIYPAGAFARPGFRPLGLALLGIVGAAIALFATRDLSPEILRYPPEHLLSGPLVIDLFAHTARWAILIAGALLVLLTDPPPDEHQAAEYSASLLLIVAGLMIAVAANDLVLLFMALELVSIPTYIVLYLGKRGAHAQEATIKYFFLSILSSALLLYGFSFLYGLGGSTRLDAIAAAMRNPDGAASASPFAAVALVLVFAGLAFRLALAPFHFYAPDVFQGTSNANAGMLSTAPKLAGLLVLVRLITSAMPGMESLGWKLALAVSILTMTWGNIVALWQSNVRRLLAYSSIAHAGYMMIGLAVGMAQTELSPTPEPLERYGVNGIGTALFYLAVYALATLGTFAALAYLRDEHSEVDEVDELSGLGRTHPYVAAAIAVFMFSLAGIPPMAGFWGKFALFTGALDVGAPVSGERSGLQDWFLALAIIGVLNAAIAAAYYLRIVATMYFRAPESTATPVSSDRAADQRRPSAPAIAAALSCALVIGAGILPGSIMDAADAAGHAASRSNEDSVDSSLTFEAASATRPPRTAR
jgi:NADH-quinone oxidoreductase subunit N